ncbi:hypothetical protein RvY_05851 [Ramazzottius varieornatus]|uniref:Uncharacterized protein n=1 Tax=Ramazzottius varieornatus TaxID=947166 RepID=A0A1D1V221_RAMVA|nr:hypothetical protein RvY_05851 [Ramazzottius varieornatus]
MSSAGCELGDGTVILRFRHSKFVMHQGGEGTQKTTGRLARFTVTVNEHLGFNEPTSREPFIQGTIRLIYAEA